MSWLIASSIAILSITLGNEDGEIFFISEVCIGIPIIRRDIYLFQTDYLKNSKPIFNTGNTLKSLLRNESEVYWYSVSLQEDKRTMKNDYSAKWINRDDYKFDMNQESYRIYC